MLSLYEEFLQDWSKERSKENKTKHVGVPTNLRYSDEFLKIFLFWDEFKKKLREEFRINTFWKITKCYVMRAMSSEYFLQEFLKKNPRNPSESNLEFLQEFLRVFLIVVPLRILSRVFFREFLWVFFLRNFFGSSL